MYVQVIDLEVATTDPWVVATTVRVHNCQGQMILEGTGPRLVRVAVPEGKREKWDACLLVSKQPDIQANDQVLTAGASVSSHQ